MWDWCSGACSSFEASYKGTITTGADPTHSTRISMPTKPLGDMLEHVACLFEVTLDFFQVVFEHREGEDIKQNTTTENKTQKPKKHT